MPPYKQSGQWQDVLNQRKAAISFVMTVRLPSVMLSVRPHGATRLPLDRLPLNLILEYFSKICPENSSFIKI